MVEPHSILEKLRASLVVDIWRNLSYISAMNTGVSSEVRVEMYRKTLNVELTPLTVKISLCNVITHRI